MSKLQFEKFTTREGLVNAKINLNDKQVSLHSIYPYKEAKKIATRFNSDLKWIVIAGFGLGYIVEHLLKNTEHNILVFEHTDEIIDFAKSNRDISAILKNKRLSVVNTTNQLTDFLDEHRIKEMTFYIHRPYLSLFPDIYSSIEGQLITYLSKSQINKATLNRFQKVWLRNILKNSRYYFDTPGIIDIRHNFKTKPAIIVGAGPSLDKQLPKLKAVQDKVVIIATDTALPMLHANNIKSDFVVSVDPQNKNALYLLYSDCTDTTLVIDSAASFMAMSKFKPKNTLLFDSMFPLYEQMKNYWGEKGSLRSGGSVSTTAFDFARFLEAEPIIFIGQDLAFSEKQTHARGNILEDFFYHRTNRLDSIEKYNSLALIFSDKIMVDGYYNNKVPSDRKFVTFLNWFKREIKTTDATVINSTEGGAKIEGTIQITFDEMADKYLTAVLDKNIELNLQPKERKEFDVYLHLIKSTCDELLPLASKASIAANTALNIFKQGKDPSAHYGTMTAFDKKLLSIFKANNKTAIARFMEFTMQGSIDKILENSQATEVNISLLTSWVELYSEAYTGIKNIKHLVKKVVGK